MNDNSPNDIMHASSFLQGHNAEYVEQLYARYADNPNAVDESWRDFFKSLGDAPADAKAEAAGPSWGRTDWPPVPNDDLTAALDGQWAVEPAAAGDKIKAKAADKGGEYVCTTVHVCAAQLYGTVRARLRLCGALKPSTVVSQCTVMLL